LQQTLSLNPGAAELAHAAQRKSQKSVILKKDHLILLQSIQILQDKIPM